MAIMNKGFLIGIIIVIVGLAIAAGVLQKPVLAMLIPAGVLVGGWIYFVGMAWKRKAKIFYDRMEPEAAEKRYKILKVFLVISGVALAVGIIGVIVHNVIYGVTETEEVVSFFFGFIGLAVFFITAIVSLIIVFKGRQKAI